MRVLIFTLHLLMDLSHQACANSGRTKTSGLNQIALTEKDKTDILLHHNDLRMLTGSSNMRYMSWDSELEWLAKEYSTNCNFQHNPNRKHSRGWSVGENIYARLGDMTAADSLTAIQRWYDEVSQFNQADGTCKPGKMCGHYTQIVWAKTFKIGCALTNCNWIRNFVGNGRGSLFICNYATSGNIIGSDGKLLTVYQKGTACSRCDKNDYCRNNLCANSARDFFGPNKTTNLQDQCTCLNLLISVIVLCTIVFAQIVFILYRERVRIMVRIGLWRAGRRPMQSNRFSNQNTPSASIINTPRHSVTALHGIHRVGSPSPAMKCRDKIVSLEGNRPEQKMSLPSRTPLRTSPALPSKK